MYSSKVPVSIRYSYGSQHVVMGRIPTLLVIYALKRAALLIKELGGGKITSEIIDIYPNPVADFEVEVKYAHIDRLIGKKI